MLGGSRDRPECLRSPGTDNIVLARQPFGQLDGGVIVQRAGRGQRLSRRRPDGLVAILKKLNELGAAPRLPGPETSIRAPRPPGPARSGVVKQPPATWPLPDQPWRLRSLTADCRRVEASARVRRRVCWLAPTPRPRDALRPGRLRLAERRCARSDLGRPRRPPPAKVAQRPRWVAAFAPGGPLGAEPRLSDQPEGVGPPPAGPGHSDPRPGRASGSRPAKVTHAAAATAGRVHEGRPGAGPGRNGGWSDQGEDLGQLVALLLGQCRHALRDTSSGPITAAPNCGSAFLALSWIGSCGLKVGDRLGEDPPWHRSEHLLEEDQGEEQPEPGQHGRRRPGGLARTCRAITAESRRGQERR